MTIYQGDLSKQVVPDLSKPSHKHNKPKRGNHTKFSDKVRKAIVERDDGLCVFCGRTYNSIHHIIFASAGGKGEITNGVCVCTECHEWAHRGRKGRKWFENYRKTKLLTLLEEIS